MKAKDSPLALCTSFPSQKLIDRFGRVFRVAEELDYGMVGINTGLIATEVAPFGGVKQSGLGREGSHHGVEEFLEMKYLLLAGM